MGSKLDYISEDKVICSLLLTFTDKIGIKLQSRSICRNFRSVSKTFLSIYVDILNTADCCVDKKPSNKWLKWNRTSKRFIWRDLEWYWGRGKKIAHQNVLMTFKNGVYQLFYCYPALICAIRVGLPQTQNVSMDCWYVHFNEKIIAKCQRFHTQQKKKKRETVWKRKTK